MKIAKQLKDNNVCEYLLYMWQIEDTLRAFSLDIDRLDSDYISHLQLSADEACEEREWMENLIRMMHEEGCVEHGHLQINKGTLSLLIDLHQQLLHSPKHPFYSAAYYKSLPFIVELRSRGNKEVGELETCFQSLYGVMLLRLQKRPISSETQLAVDTISHLLALLADAWRKEREGQLEL